MKIRLPQAFVTLADFVYPVFRSLCFLKLPHQDLDYKIIWLFQYLDYDHT